MTASTGHVYRQNFTGYKTNHREAPCIKLTSSEVILSTKAHCVRGMTETVPPFLSIIKKTSRRLRDPSYQKHQKAPKARKTSRFAD